MVTSRFVVKQTLVEEVKTVVAMPPAALTVMVPVPLLSVPYVIVLRAKVTGLVADTAVLPYWS